MLTLADEARHLLDHPSQILVLLHQIPHQQHYQLHSLLLVTRKYLQPRLEIPDILLFSLSELPLRYPVLRFPDLRGGLVLAPSFAATVNRVIVVGMVIVLIARNGFWKGSGKCGEI